LNVSSEVWEVQPPMRQGRWLAGAAVVREHIYVVGGVSTGHPRMSDEATSSAERFGGAWFTLPPMSHCRSRCSTAVIHNKLYVSCREGHGGQSSLERFDPPLDMWELLKPMLHRRVYTTIVGLRDRLYVCGGVDNARSVLNSVECYDPSTDSWEASAPMLHARHNAQPVRANNCLYVFGCATRGNTRSFFTWMSAERFDPVTRTWKALPDPRFEPMLVAAIHP